MLSPTSISETTLLLIRRHGVSVVNDEIRASYTGEFFFNPPKSEKRLQRVSRQRERIAIGLKNENITELTGSVDRCVKAVSISSRERFETEALFQDNNEVEPKFFLKLELLLA